MIYSVLITFGIINSNVVFLRIQINKISQKWVTWIMTAYADILSVNVPDCNTVSMNRFSLDFLDSFALWKCMKKQWQFVICQ